MQNSAVSKNVKSGIFLMEYAALIAVCSLVFIGMFYAYSQLDPVAQGEKELSSAAKDECSRLAKQQEREISVTVPHGISVTLEKRSSVPDDYRSCILSSSGRRMK